MKVQVEKEVLPAWEPLKVTITLESEGEARLLYHCFNRAGVRKVLFSDNYGEDYNEVDTQFEFSSSAAATIGNVLRDRGFEI